MPPYHRRVRASSPGARDSLAAVPPRPRSLTRNRTPEAPGTSRRSIASTGHDGRPLGPRPARRRRHVNLAANRSRPALNAGSEARCSTAGLRPPSLTRFIRESAQPPRLRSRFPLVSTGRAESAREDAGPGAIFSDWPLVEQERWRAERGDPVALPPHRNVLDPNEAAAKMVAFRFSPAALRSGASNVVDSPQDWCRARWPSRRLNCAAAEPHAPNR